MSISGKLILVTKQFNESDAFDSMLRSQGAVLEYFPTIKIQPLKNNPELDLKLHNAANYYGVIFTSANGAKYFFERAEKLRVRYSGKIYSIGEKTKEKVESYGYQNYFTPERSNADDFAEELDLKELKDKRILIVRGNLSLDKVRKKLSKYAEVDEVIAYENEIPEADSIGNLDEVNTLVSEDKVDCIVFFSPSAIANFLNLIQNFEQKKTVVGVIGNTTSEAAEKHGLKVGIVPRVPDSEEMAKSIIEYFESVN